jgi:DNA modification methylase
VHRWTPWIAGFSSSFVQGVFDALLPKGNFPKRVLDPFAGVGTTLIEGLKCGYDIAGFEINPYAYLACKVKTRSIGISPQALNKKVESYQAFMKERLGKDKTPKSCPPAGFKSREVFFSPKVERKVLFTLDFISGQKEEWAKEIFKLALGAVMVSFSNYSYEPSLGRRSSSGKPGILDADVPAILSSKLGEFVADIGYLKSITNQNERGADIALFHHSYLDMNGELSARSVDMLVTSPPYLNNYHYVRNTRPHLYWLDLGVDQAGMKKLETTSFGKYWQTVRGGPVIQPEFEIGELIEIIAQLREINTEKGAYGGHGWANYATAYFNDCAKFLAKTKRVMKKGAPVVVVIGNNILQGIEIKTDVFFAKIGEQMGYKTINIHKVRTKRTGSSIINSSVRTASKGRTVELYETAVELRAP